jgi:hypothetical protein
MTRARGPGGDPVDPSRVMPIAAPRADPGGDAWRPDAMSMSRFKDGHGCLLPSLRKPDLPGAQLCIGYKAPRASNHASHVVRLTPMESQYAQTSIAVLRRNG